MFNFLKKKEKVFVYLVFKNEQEDSLVTILSKQGQIKEFIDKMVIIDHWDHYVAWCKLRELNYKDIESEQAYIENFYKTATQEDMQNYTYIVKRAAYNTDAIASILRMFNGCVPIGCSYEFKGELAYASMIYSDIIKEEKEKDAE